YLSGSRRLSYSISSRRTSGSHGLSSALTSTTTVSGGAPSPRRNSTGSLAFFGFQLNHSSDPSLRMVGRNRSRLRWLSAWASSTQATSYPSRDLTESAV